jgi:hypothetical protein
MLSEDHSQNARATHPREVDTVTNQGPGPGQVPGQGQGQGRTAPRPNGAKELARDQREAPKKPVPMGKAKRRVRNFVLQPLLQVKVGLYFILVSLLFATALALIIYYNFGGLVNSIVLLTDAEEEVRELFLDYWKGTQLWIYFSFAVYLLASIGLSVFYTHRMVGPTFAFRRHIRSIAEGRYHVRTHLRKGDAFSEVADELNHLSEVMERTRGLPHNPVK